MESMPQDGSLVEPTLGQTALGQTALGPTGILVLDPILSTSWPVGATLSDQSSVQGMLDEAGMLQACKYNIGALKYGGVPKQLMLGALTCGGSSNAKRSRVGPADKCVFFVPYKRVDSRLVALPHRNKPSSCSKQDACFFHNHSITALTMEDGVRQVSCASSLTANEVEALEGYAGCSLGTAKVRDLKLADLTAT